MSKFCGDLKKMRETNHPANQDEQVQRASDLALKAEVLSTLNLGPGIMGMAPPPRIRLSNLATESLVSDTGPSFLFCRLQSPRLVVIGGHYERDSE